MSVDEWRRGALGEAEAKRLRDNMNAAHETARQRRMQDPVRLEKRRKQWRDYRPNKKKREAGQSL